MCDERDEIIVLIDDDGDEVAVEHIDTIIYKDKEYVILKPTDDCDDDDEDDDDENGDGDGDGDDESEEEEGNGGHGAADAAGGARRRRDGASNARQGVEGRGDDDDALDDMDDDYEEDGDMSCDGCPDADECWSDLEEEEIVILRVEKNDDGSETYVTIDDESEQDAVFELFMERVEEDAIGFDDIDDDLDGDNT